MKTLHIACSVALALACLVCAVSAETARSIDLGPWPQGASPQEIGKRVAERFVASPHPIWPDNPQPYIIYPEVCCWYGALTFAKLTGDQDLTNRLVARFE